MRQAFWSGLIALPFHVLGSVAVLLALDLDWPEMIMFMGGLLLLGMGQTIDHVLHRHL